MIRQSIDVDGYWEVIVYYDVDFDLFYFIEEDLKGIGFSGHNLETLYQDLSEGRAKAVTCSSPHHRKSIVLFNKHKSVRDYINSIVHEAEHVKQAMLKVYDVEDRGEAPAYTIGYLVGRMYSVFKGMLCK